MKKLLAAALVLLTASFLSAQNFNRQKMDSLFSTISANDKGMGSVSIFSNGKEVYKKSIGFADVENKISNNENTLFRIGSISKTFTAAIILQMVDEKKLNLSDKLDKFYPEIANSGKITIEDLLRHRSGIHNFTDDKEYEEWMVKPHSHDEMIKKIASFKSEFKPGEKHSYSNSNYVILSYIAEKIDKSDFSSILKNRIVTKCGLKNTRYGGKINTSANEALSYSKEEGKWVKTPETDMSIPSGAGAIVSTATDLNIFYYDLFNKKIISDSLLEKMMKMVDNYGLGLVQFPFYDKKVYGHTGGIDGFQSFAGYLPDEKVNVAYVSNGVAMSRNDIILGVLNIYFGKEYKLPEFKPEIKLNPADLSEYPGTYSKEGFPIKLDIIQEGDHLFGQGTGQARFPLVATGKTTFVNEEAGISIRFDTGKLFLKQGSMELEMLKESAK